MVWFAYVYFHRLVFSKNLMDPGPQGPRVFLLSYAKTQNARSGRKKNSIELCGSKDSDQI